MTTTEGVRVIDDDAIRKLVTRLARRDKNGASVIERAAILAEGADSRAIVAWIEAQDGHAEEQVRRTAPGGLHGGSLHGARPTASTTPRRYVLPPGVLT
ncbi:MAG: hypothetical protein ACLP50_11645 [Solirubrobacteraceae bacterium]